MVLNQAHLSAVVYVVEERPNPSSDYFVLPALRAAGCRIIRCGFRQVPASADLDGACIVFVRYVPQPWMRLVEAHRSRLRRVVLFMDDDLLDRRAAKGLPWRYRWKLARLSTWRRGWLRGQGAELWVSTPYLEAKYAEWHPRLIPAVALPAVERDDSVRLFYHGSASHASEIRWLYPVIETVLRLEPRLTFEIIGGADVNRHYRRLPRTSVVHPMSWPAYQAFLTVPGRHIGLAPLLDEPFNRARACTKFFDITRAGAVGLYASAGVCGDTIEHGVNGWLAPLDVGTWVEAIRFLVQDAVLRQALLGYAREKLGAFSLTAHDMGAAQNGEPVLDSADARKRQ